MSVKVYSMAILDNYMFRPLLAIFSLSAKELKAYYIYVPDNYMFRHVLAIFRLYSRELKALLYIYIYIH